MLAVAALSALLSPALLPAQISLGTAVNLAQRNSSAVKLAQADLNKTYAVLAQSKDVFIPNLVIGSDIGPPTIGFPTGQPSIANASMQSLAFSFSQGQYIKAARAGVDAATLTLKDAKEQVALDASTAYIELDTVNRELAAARDQSGFSDRLVAIEQQRSDAGVDSVSELLQARLTAAELRLKMIHLESRARTLASQIATLAGLPVASISADHASIPEIPAVKADEPGTLTAGIEAARAQARSKQLQAHGDWIATRIRPVIDFGAQYNLDSDALNHYSQYFNHFTPNNFSAGFLITIPLFDKSRQARARNPPPTPSAPPSRPNRPASERYSDRHPHRKPPRTRHPGRNRHPEAADIRRAVEGRRIATAVRQWLRLRTGRVAPTLAQGRTTCPHRSESEVY